MYIFVQLRLFVPCIKLWHLNIVTYCLLFAICVLMLYTYVGKGEYIYRPTKGGIRCDRRTVQRVGHQLDLASNFLKVRMKADKTCLPIVSELKLST